MNSKFSNFVTLVGNVSQVIIAGSILAELYYRIRDRKKPVTEPDPDDDGDLSTSSSQSPLAA